ncbi:glycosyltransferase family 39 protein [Hymenobacter endophyticus]|uniref:Glycosyltransferase family 39 protein n=1 Tax=Hymenobacter endophyticus TaxID=3076335 RepID=A0ABU3TG79_9BACT|nr:glycosyltransferase family 39 protein [Hymenobacter endophyticus]MDU0370368.1 glycosyltransferase family 39 protein [Hymenobacter endophyticus]
MPSSTNTHDRVGLEKFGFRASLRRTWPRVWPILLLGAVLRLLFLLVGAKVYYAGRQIDIHTTGDTFSYVLSFQNLLEYGRYTFDPREPDASVGRLPGYPFFYGIHYLLFGAERAVAAVAVTQVLLDTLGIWLLYVITARLAPPRSWAPTLGALLLAAYPFSIVWTTIVGTESLGLFLVLLWWAVLLLGRRRPRTWLLLGCLLAVIVYVREFLGVCLVVTVAYLFLSQERGQRRLPVALVLAGFLSLYIWWPIRNYVTLGRLIPLKPAAAGYANLREDTQAALAWVLTWTNDVTMGIDEILFAPKPAFPAHVISTAAEKQLLDSLIVLSRSCASSFHVRAQAKLSASATPPADPQAELLRHTNCNALVSKGFSRLRASYIARHPVRARLEVPLHNFQKILFKSQFKTGAGAALTTGQRVAALLFTWRSIVLLVGLVGAWRFRRVPGLWPALLFAALIFGYMAAIFRSMEMRYLLQADVVMLVPAALLLGNLLPRRREKTVQVVATRQELPLPANS